jgi:HD-GYP domain-containing protein (c-di-GMP phosphodiesterase class II)
MRRRVLYCARSRAAADAARRVRGQFDVAALPARAVPGDVRTVLLTDGVVPEPPSLGHVRVVGLVRPRAAGPWPAHWHAVLPAGVGVPILRRTIESAFAELERAESMTRLGRELADLNAIGVQLSAERDRAVLLKSILAKARGMTGSDAGSLYLVEESADGERRLVFVLAENDSVAVPFETTTLPLTRNSVAGYVALTGDIVNLADAYAPPAGAPFRINRAFDDALGYRTRSMLVVPMRTPNGHTIGVLQLINSKRVATRLLRTGADFQRHVRAFDRRHEQLAGSLASQAAVAVENRRLYESVERLFEGFVQASVTAIEARDPTTSGHSFRVADLCAGLARAVTTCASGPYRSVHFNEDELLELRYAALLHDFGKVGVREQVLVKAKKLYPWELERVRLRAELIRRGLALRVTGAKLERVLARGTAGYAEYARGADAELEALLADIDADLARVARANEPELVATDTALDFTPLTLPRFLDHHGRRESLLTPAEAEALAVARGSLTEDEYREIQSHVVHTYEFLAHIPWTREFQRIPAIARYHHEKLDGSGYPDGLKGDDIPLQSRLMTIADIYDALTAGDRPYKRAMSPAQALDILGEERRAGRIDAALFDIFVDARIFETTARA